MTKKHDPTLYTVKVNATKPFMLSFAESYDPLWYAQVTAINNSPVNSEIVRPVPLYSVINGFWINETGDLDITIEYEPQAINGFILSFAKELGKKCHDFQPVVEKLAAERHDIGAAISLITLILSILYLVFNGMRPHSDALKSLKPNLSKIGFMIYDWRKNRRKKEEPYKSGTNWKTEQKPLEMPKIVTKTVGAINDRSRLIIKRRSNPELKALHNHVVHKEYHYKHKTTISSTIKKMIEIPSSLRMIIPHFVSDEYLILSLRSYQKQYLLPNIHNVCKLYVR